MTLVELDVFSGRENPRWHLDRPAEAELRRLVERLPPAVGASPEPPGLGYRGFVVSGPAGPYRVYGSYVQTPTGLRLDSDRTTERLLLSTLPRQLDDLRQVIETEIQPP